MQIVFTRTNMGSKTLQCGILFMAIIYQAACSSKGWYTAGVVEYAPSNLNGTEHPQHLIMRNARRFQEIIDLAAKNNVDILVFPEDGLTSMYQIPGVTHREDYIPYLIELPKEDIAPCDHPETHEQTLQLFYDEASSVARLRYFVVEWAERLVKNVVRMLSCAARQARLYLVINLSEKIPCTNSQPGCPSDGLMLYNTNVAFDRNGKIISRYTKYNLCVEPEFNRTAGGAHLSVFETDFGARFGMFICFDLLFQDPSIRLITEQHVTDIAFPVAWFSELPFVSAVELQAGFSYANNVNFLASGLNRPKSKNAGSGIYAGNKAILVTTMPEKSSTHLLIARVPLRDTPYDPSFHTGRIITIEEASETEGLAFFNDNFSKFETRVLDTNTRCADMYYRNDEFVCNITAAYSVENNQSGNTTYRLVAFSGERYYADVKVTIEICAVVACPNAELTSCGQRPEFSPFQPIALDNVDISIKSNRTLSTFPLTMDNHMLPMNTDSYWFNKRTVKHKDFSEEKQNMVLKATKRNLITFGILRN